MTARPSLAALLAVLASLLAPLARPQAPVRAPEPTKHLERTPNDALDAQIRRVIESMDSTGHPPRGVAQGGRRGGRRGVFENAEGQLPRKPPGYYIETDVWPRRASGRGAQRLVFGREREVYYTANHYRTFVRVR